MKIFFYALRMKWKYYSLPSTIFQNFEVNFTISFNFYICQKKKKKLNAITQKKMFCWNNKNLVKTTKNFVKTTKLLLF